MSTKKREMLAVAATPEDRKQLEKIAMRLGYLHGDRPNVSGLIRAIASGDLIVTPLSAIVSPVVSRRPLHRQRRAKNNRSSPR